MSSSLRRALRSTILLDELIFGEIGRRHDAAIHHQGVPIDKIGIVADQEKRGFGLILCGSQPPRKILKSPAPGYVIIEPNGGTGTIGHDTVDPNLIRGQLHCHRPRHINHTSFGCSISDAIGPSYQAGGGTKIEDLSPSALLRHLSCNVLRHEIRSFEAHGDNFIEFLFRTFKDVRVVRQSGVVDENIDAAEARYDLADHRFHVARFGDVA